MADNRVKPNVGLFDKLIPPRFIEFQFLLEPSNRKMPADYRVSTSTTNQTSEHFEPTNPRHRIDEMRAVESNYTARIENEGLPFDARKLYRLIADMTVKAVSDFAKHFVISIETVNAIRCIDQYVKKTMSKLNTPHCGRSFLLSFLLAKDLSHCHLAVRRNLSSRTDDNRLYRFHVHLTNYAETLCSLLNFFSQQSLIRQPWIIIDKALCKKNQI